MKTLIPSQWTVPKRFRERVGESAGRQRQMTEEGHLLLVLHGLPQPGNPERAARLFWRDKAGAWKSAGQGTGVGPLRAHVTEFEEAVDRHEDRLRTASTAADYFDVLKAATPLHRTSRNLLRTLQEAREAIDDRELINLRDRAGEIERASELLVAEARDGLDYTSAQQAEAQSKVSLQLARDGHKLNTIAAVFLPITALASIFSMTLRSGLETWFSPWLFWVIVGAGVALGFTMKARVAPSEQPVEPVTPPVKTRRALVRVSAEA
ncbi:MAG: CorA family divalent cation transporter [Archangium sp.]|nr:CorA family divalent cation transporter [Archangium sp.]